jgi:hypothetical protein
VRSTKTLSPQAAFRAIIALLTFSVGLAVVSVWLIRRHSAIVPEVETVKAKEKIVSPKFVEVFSDFEYVGNAALSETIPPHKTDAQSLPQIFEAKRQYIFHRPNPTDNDSLFIELQNRLRSKNITILTAQGNIHAYIDGLHFHILFQDGKYRGRIENQLDPQIAKTDDIVLRKRLFIDDYILTIEEIKEAE